MAGTFLIFTTPEWENSRLHSERGKHCKTRRRHSKVSQEMGGCPVTLCLFFFYQTEAAIYFKELFVHFQNEKHRPYPVIEGPVVFTGWWGSGTWHCPSVSIRVAFGKGGSMFSHASGRRTLKCYLMLAGEHVDTAGFFRRASESMHNNFAIYCGLVMVHCRCYIGLECTSLFLREPTQWVVGHYGHWPTHDFYNKAWWLGLNRPTKLPSWRRTFLRGLCQHFYTCSILYKEIWLTKRTSDLTTVFSQTPSNKLPYWDFQHFQFNHLRASGDWYKHNEENYLFFPPLIAIRPQFVIYPRNVYVSKTICGRLSHSSVWMELVITEQSSCV